ncbi:two-component sensor histidine kinase [Aphanothece sacrum FPU1]|uniref:histidine kinase n=2 Tax=Aphanothece sacrum TaxID=1122 RepID=A0A401IEY9_APHSA|nr:two-component sensor histidine kinase [Aphanothece sacrum FPU1]GBF84845.1 two-component sensor histidine kinase [Aphanothece sacrum FPU3]
MESFDSLGSSHWEALIRPLVLIPADLTVTDFLPYLQEKNYQPQVPQPPYGLIDESGKFLGLLNTWEMLQTLLNQEIIFSQQPSFETSEPLLRELLEDLPLPMMLQTQQGETFIQNRTWREQIGEFVPPDNASACSLPLPVEKKVSLNSSSFALSETIGYSNPQEWNNSSSLAANLSYSQWLKSIPKRQNQSGRDSPFHSLHPLISSTTPSLGQIPQNERVWQFVKCFLKSKYISPPIALILATDVSQQQQLCQELVAKNADLVQLNRLKDEFLACISHELKSPLTAVVGLSSLLQEQKVGTLNSRQVHYAELIYRSGRQLMTLVNDLLDLTRLETGQLRLTFVPLSIKSICEQAYYSIREKYQGKTDHPLSFSLEIEPGLDRLVADELRLHQMLVHLLDNAMKFTQGGGKFGLQVNRWENWIAFTIWDTGIGIPEESQHLIFQKFQQLENPLTRKFEGTGLGLVLSQRLARAHGGEISFTSKVDQGSQFTVLLPPSAPGEENSLSPSHYPNPLILIVEAIPKYIEDLMDKLTKLHYRVVIARTGTEAVEKARQLQPFAVFLNPLLPLLSGWDVLTLLKSDPQTQRIKVFVCTIQPNEPLSQMNRADGFLSVPADLSALQTLLGCEKPTPTVTTRPLTILRLYPNFTTVKGFSTESSPRLNLALLDQLSQFNHRILEADDLEQAQMLAYVWNIDVIVVDGRFLDDPLTYLRSLSEYLELAELPLVTLDIKTTQAANQISKLSVFPCLIPEDEQHDQQLWQVIQIATSSQS